MFTGRVISTVPRFQDFLNIVYGHDLDEHDNVTEANAIYTYKLMNYYKANKLEVSGISKHESELPVDETRSFVSSFFFTFYFISSSTDSSLSLSCF